MRVRGAADGIPSLSGHGRNGPNREDMPGHGLADRNDHTRDHQPSTVIPTSGINHGVLVQKYGKDCKFECSDTFDNTMFKFITPRELCRHYLLNTSHHLDNLESLMRYRGVTDPSALQLLRDLLQLSPSKRIKASQALQVRFLDNLAGHRTALGVVPHSC